MSDYFVIQQTSAGAFIYQYGSKKELEKALMDRERFPGLFTEDEEEMTLFMAGIDNEDVFDTYINNWGIKMMIIKGKPVVPEPQQQVTIWKVE